MIPQNEDEEIDIPRLDDLNDTNPLKTMMDTMAKHGANVELKRKMPDGTYQTASEGTMKALGAQARMSSTAQVLDTMCKEERDLWAIEMRKMANELYKEHKYDEALGRYMEAITASDLGTAADSQSNIDTVIVPLLCNMSACCVQLKDWGKVVRFCEQCLQLRPKCVKALSRRGLARVHLGEYVTAQSDILNALEFLPEDEAVERERIKAILMKAKKGVSEQNKALEKRKASMRKAFASKDGGIGDKRVKTPPKVKLRKQSNVTNGNYIVKIAVITCVSMLIMLVLYMILM